MQMDNQAKILAKKIVDQEVQWETARSSGAGGQHVNKNETKIILVWNISQSSVLTDDQRDLLQQTYKNKISNVGALRVSSQRYRSQPRNKEDVISKFENIIQSLYEQKKERKYRKKVPKAEKEKRLEEKKRRQKIKDLRKKIF